MNRRTAPRLRRSAAPAPGWSCRGRDALRSAAIGGLLVLAFAGGGALAQNTPVPPADVPSGAAPADPLQLAPALPDLGPPAATPPKPTPPAAAAPAPKPDTGFTLEAKLTEDGEDVPAGIVWRVFSEHPAPDGKLALIRQATGGVVHVELKPGAYFVHATFGRAGTVKEINVNGPGGHDTVVLNAGGLQLDATLGKDQPLPPNAVDFQIYAGDTASSDEKNPVAPHVKAGQMVRLNAGNYHIVSRYGDANAIVRADFKVEAGKLTEAVMTQQAARITLKLVADAGGEALANTAWSVTTPGGDSVFDMTGAFPDVVLAAGDYTAVAKHDGKIHERSFKVESGVNREIEVLAR